MRKSIFVLLFLGLLFALTVPAFAQADLPPWVTVNSQGQIAFNPNGLTSTGAIMLPPPPGYASVQIDLGNGQQLCVGCLTFNTYQAADGSAVIIPTNYAAVVMAQAQYNPFNQPIEGYLGNTLVAIAAESGDLDPAVDSPQAIQDAQAIHDLLASGQLDPLFLAHMNAEMNDPNSPLFQNDLFLGAGLFVFRCSPVTGSCQDAAAGTDQPLAPNGNPPEPGSTPVPPDECPLNLRVSQAAPIFNLGPFAPAHPIVVGQDPQRRGVDVPASVQIPPVIVKYDIPKYDHTCEYVGGTVTDSACQNNPGWKNTKVFAGCETKTEVYPDQIKTVQVAADLSAPSIGWITTELAAKYPGAHVYQAHWTLWPGSLSQGGLSADGTALSITAAKLPLADPGKYTVSINGTTTGTPYTAPRPFAYADPDLLVYLLESTIIK